MSPLKIKMLLHYYCTNERFPFNDSPAEQEALEYFTENGYLSFDGTVPVVSLNKQKFTATEKLHVYCEALQNVPEPRQIWVV